MDNKNITNQSEQKSDSEQTQVNSISLPSVVLPKGGGAIRSIEEKFQVNAITGTSALNIPIPDSPSRGGFVPAIGLSYNSANGNSAFGIGWQLDVPSIRRKTQNQLPLYNDEDESVHSYYPTQKI